MLACKYTSFGGPVRGIFLCVWRQGSLREVILTGPLCRRVCFIISPCVSTNGGLFLGGGPPYSGVFPLVVSLPWLLSCPGGNTYMAPRRPGVFSKYPPRGGVLISRGPCVEKLVAVCVRKQPCLWLLRVIVGLLISPKRGLLTGGPCCPANRGAFPPPRNFGGKGPGVSGPDTKGLGNPGPGGPPRTPWFVPPHFCPSTPGVPNKPPLVWGKEIRFLNPRCILPARGPPKARHLVFPPNKTFGAPRTLFTTASCGTPWNGR